MGGTRPVCDGGLLSNPANRKRVAPTSFLGPFNAQGRAVRLGGMEADASGLGLGDGGGYIPFPCFPIAQRLRPVRYPNSPPC